MVCKQTLTNTTAVQYLTQTFKELRGDGGNEVTLPQHVWTDSSCSSNALCPLGESRACQQDGYIKKKLQKRKEKGSGSNLILKGLKKKKKKWSISTISCGKTAAGQLEGCLPQAWLCGRQQQCWQWRPGKNGAPQRGTNGDVGWEWGEGWHRRCVQFRTPHGEHLGDVGAAQRRDMKSTTHKKAWDSSIPSSFIQYNTHVYISISSSD